MIRLAHDAVCETAAKDWAVGRDDWSHSSSGISVFNTCESLFEQYTGR